MAEHTEKKPLRTLQDLEDYIAKFNRDEFEEYFGYYSKNIRMNFGEAVLTDQTLDGYINWIKPAHAAVSEELQLFRWAWDRERNLLAADYHVQFRGRKGVDIKQFQGGWGPAYHGHGPLVGMSIWYHLDERGFVKELEASGAWMMKMADPKL